jgi:uncharacterized protein
MTFEAWFQGSYPQISERSIEAVVRLMADGATVPFIARYRKEQTGNLDEVAIQNIFEAKERFEQLVQRQQFIVAEIEKQGKLTDELKSRILSTFQSQQLEDLYLPYKQKRKSKASLAREAGLEPLADWIWNTGHGTETPQPGQTLEIWAFTFRNEAKNILDAQTAIDGATDILIERLSEDQGLRQRVRETLFEKGHLISTKADKAKPNSKYEMYFAYNEGVSSLIKPENSHRYLAIRRGWIEEELKLSLGPKPEPKAEGESVPGLPEGYELDLLREFERTACTVFDSPGANQLLKASKLAFRAHVLPSIENEVHKALKEVADNMAIHVFAENVKKLLLAPPFGPKGVLGVDPGVRTGCKLAWVDDSGKYVKSGVILLQTDAEKENAKAMLLAGLQEAPVRAIAVGNGTAGRETEIFVRKTLKDAGLQIPVILVNEAGASVYSASEAAREEFPDLDVTVRGAISIARRLQDPLAELVKIEPKSIGVGQYQHDVNQPALKRSLDFVVDSCVNQVGVNLNTASYHLLSHVSGIGPALAKSVVEYRGQKGLFQSRQELLEIPRFNQKTFELAAGFLRIPESSNPLDNTGVHPEQYPVLEGFARSHGMSVSDLMGQGASSLRKAAGELEKSVGEFTLKDLISELEKPGRDPRDEFVPFQFREDLFELKDLKADMVCPGIVTNVTNFGVFVDVGVHQDGLVHISQLADRFVKDPRTLVSPGVHVQVRVLEVNLEKKQISFSMKGLAGNPGYQEKQAAPPREHRRPERNAEPRQARGGNDQRRREHAPQRNQPAPFKPSNKPAPVVKPKQVFNNAFAGLASLRSNLKPK